MIVRMQHARECNFCARGVRAFFALHGLDLAVFLRDGLAADVLLATGDAMALAVVERARRG